MPFPEGAAPPVTYTDPLVPPEVTMLKIGHARISSVDFMSWQLGPELELTVPFNASGHTDVRRTEAETVTAFVNALRALA